MNDPLRVLIVEDSLTQAIQMEMILEEAGFESQTASSAEEALDKLHSEPFDLVLSDLHLPGESGFELCHRIKSSPEMQHIGVVVITSQADPANALRGLEAGADSFATKGSDPERVISSLRTVARRVSAGVKKLDPLHADFMGESFRIAATRQGILDVLVSSFEDVVNLSRQLEKSERALQATLMSVLDTVPVGIVTVDAAGVPQLVNRSVREIFATKEVGALSRWINMYGIRRGDGSQLEPNQLPTAATLLDGEPRIEAELMLKRLGAEPRHVLVSTTAVKEDAEVVEVVTTFTSITERKRIEQALRDQEEQYALAAAGAKDGLWDWDVANNQVFYSVRWMEMLGLDPERVTNSPQEWLGRVHEDDLEDVWEGIGKHLSRRAETFENEHRIRHADGTYRWMLVRGRAVFDEDNEATRMAGWMTDLSERRKAADAEEKSALLEHATDSVGIGIAIMLEDANLTKVSSVLQSMIAAWPSPAAWWQHVVESSEMPPGQTCPVCGTQQIVGKVIADLEPDGETRKVFDIVFTGHSHQLGHNDLGHIMLVRDITRRTEGEEALRLLNRQLAAARDEAIKASQAKSTFLANISHELRTPLHAIIGFSEHITENVVDGDFEDIEADIQTIHQSARHLNGLINDVLDLSKFEAGQMRFNNEAFDLDPFVDTVVATLVGLARTNGNELVVDPVPKAVQLYADKTKLRQVLFNLLSNAFKFTEDGRVTLSIARSESDQRWLDFVVSDTGIGIPKDEFSHLFEPFRQLDRVSTTRRYGGTGLGLTITRRICRGLGGDVYVDSAVGQGSTFTARLPIAVTLGKAGTAESSSVSAMPIRRFSEPDDV